MGEKREDLPVSVIVPVGAVTTGLATALQSITSQDYAGPVELIVVNGSQGSAAETAVRELAPHARIVSNKEGTISGALNKALIEAKSPIIARCDIHSVLPPHYLRKAASALRRTGAANVGGRQVPVGTSWFTRALALAQTTWLGTGGVRYRQGGREGPVDTVYLGTFRRDALDRIGGFNAACRVNEDYEVNWRLRARGEVVWFDPALEVNYQPRRNLWALWRQYSTYGWGKWTMLRIYPNALKLRQVAAPLLVLGLLASVVLAAVGATGTATVVPAVWLGALIGGAAVVGVCRRDASALLLPLVLATMHLGWGAGFLVGVTTSWMQRGTSR